MFLFPENMILFFRRKRKDDLSQKNTWKHDVFCKCSEKMVFPKKVAQEYDLFCNNWKGGISFFPKIGYLFFRQKMKNDLFQKIHGNMIFSVYLYKCYKYDVILLSKKAKIIFTRKNTLKVDISGITEKDDIHPRKYGTSVEIPY